MEMPDAQEIAAIVAIASFFLVRKQGRKRIPTIGCETPPKIALFRNSGHTEVQFRANLWQGAVSGIFHSSYPSKH
jgi:hypothetical protein